MPSPHGETRSRRSFKPPTIAWKQLWWPDWAALWYFPAAACAERLLAEQSYDALVSSSHPFTDHLVALRLKRRWPQLRWLVDIGDPFCFADDMPLNNFRLYRRRNQRREKLVFETADRVAVTNGRTKQRYEEVFGPEACRNGHVIGPAIPASFLETAAFAEDSPLPPESVNVVFTGNLINPVRRPRELMSWMDKVARRWAESNQRKLVFHLFGDSIEGLRTVAQAAGVHNGNVQCHGSVPRPKAAAALHAAQFVLNCGNVTDYQLPSKVMSTWPQQADRKRRVQPHDLRSPRCIPTPCHSLRVAGRPGRPLDRFLAEPKPPPSRRPP